MKIQSGACTVIAAAALILICGHAKPTYAGVPATYVVLPDDHWNEPPADFNDLRRKAFHDGIEAAHHDFDGHHAPDPKGRDEYRHPRLPEQDWAPYREAFERGYKAGWDHYNHPR